jgi:hypothetical protein
VLLRKLSRAELPDRFLIMNDKPIGKYSGPEVRLGEMTDRPNYFYGCVFGDARDAPKNIILGRADLRTSMSLNQIVRVIIRVRFWANLSSTALLDRGSSVRSCEDNDLRSSV